MDALVQNSIVALAVLVALYSVVRRFAPAPLRRWGREFMVRAASALRLERLAKKWGQTPRAGSPCGACGGCSQKPDVPQTSSIVAIKPVSDAQRPCSRS